MAADATDDSASEPGAGEIVYVSWGGTGRAVAVRHAIERAHERGRELVYLAILDDSSFGDIDDALLELTKDELTWLLETQLDLTKRQAKADDLAVRVLVRAGDVAARTIEVIDTLGDTEVLVGAPIPEEHRTAVEDLVTEVRTRTGADVVLLED